MGGPSCSIRHSYFFPFQFIIVNVIALNVNIKSGDSQKYALLLCIFIFKDFKELFYIQTKGLLNQCYTILTFKKKKTPKNQKTKNKTNKQTPNRFFTEVKIPF